MSTDIDRLAALIREVDGNHTLGASALAEALTERGVQLPGPVCSGSWDEQTACALPPDHLGWHCSAPTADDEGVVLPGATWSSRRAELVEAEELTP